MVRIDFKVDAIMLFHCRMESVMLQERKNKYLVDGVSYVLLVVFFILIVRYQIKLLNFIEWGDESETVVVAKMIASGMELYKDIFNQHGPLVFLPGALLECIGDFGIAGEKTFEILNRIEQIFKYTPSKIFLMMGINDLGENRPVSEIADNYWEVVNKITQQWNKIELFLLSILPVDFSRNTNTGLTSSNIYTVNEIIKNIAENHNATYVDMTYAFADKDGNLNNTLTTDGLHLNPDGYNVWKKEIKNLI